APPGVHPTPGQSTLPRPAPTPAPLPPTQQRASLHTLRRFSRTRHRPIRIAPIDHLSELSNVLWRRATTAADHRHTGFQQFWQLPCHRLWRLWIDPLAFCSFWRACIGARKERQRRLLPISVDDLDDLAHANLPPAIDAKCCHTMLCSSLCKPLGRVP